MTIAKLEEILDLLEKKGMEANGIDISEASISLHGLRRKPIHGIKGEEKEEPDFMTLHSRVKYKKK